MPKFFYLLSLGTLFFFLIIFSLGTDSKVCTWILRDAVCESESVNNSVGFTCNPLRGKVRVTHVQ